MSITPEKTTNSLNFQQLKFNISEVTKNAFSKYANMSLENMKYILPNDSLLLSYHKLKEWSICFKPPRKKLSCNR